jgi:hypothetical protein
MKGLSTLERVILETIGMESLTSEKILRDSGLHPNVCSNLLQSLVMRGFLKTNGVAYQINKKIPELMMEEVNSKDSKHAESLEMIEAILEIENNKFFRLQKIALDEKDLKIFHAMLLNLDSFLKEAHQKSSSLIAFKNRQVVFWGYTSLERLMNQLVAGGPR